LTPEPSEHLNTAVLKERATKGETVKSTNTVPPSTKDSLEQRRRKRKPINEVDKRTKKPTTRITGVNKPRFKPKPAVPTRKFFAPLMSIEMEADHGDNADDTTVRQQHEAPFSQEADRLPFY
jgi:hypothetical protein